MNEIKINLHMHTIYSDGDGTHDELANAAMRAGLDAIIVTDHNIWVQGIEGYFQNGDKQVLVLIGEEVHDQARVPQKNHMLIFGADRELAVYAPDPQNLIDQATQAGALTFLAHPIDPEAPKFHQDDLSWVSWDIQDFTGIELWNAMTEFKSLLKDYPSAIKYAFNFEKVAHGPFPDTIKKWDSLHAEGRKVVAVGGSDAHQLPSSLGPFKKKLFPYENHYRAVNTHLFIPEPLTGSVPTDKKMIYSALAQGHAFIGYDLPAPTEGFRFTAHQADKTYIMGDSINFNESITLQIKLPDTAECHLLRNGEIIRTSQKRGTIIHTVEQPGVYRVEAYIRYKGKRRGWIFSNPIYIS